MEVAGEDSVDNRTLAPFAPLMVPRSLPNLEAPSLDVNDSVGVTALNEARHASGSLMLVNGNTIPVAEVEPEPEVGLPRSAEALFLMEVDGLKVTLLLPVDPAEAEDWTLSTLLGMELLEAEVLNKSVAEVTEEVFLLPLTSASLHSFASSSARMQEDELLLMSTDMFLIGIQQTARWWSLARINISQCKQKEAAAVIVS